MKRNISYYRTTTLLIAVVLLLVVVMLILATYMFPQLSAIVPLFSFAMQFHFELMILAVLVAIAFGFIWARVLTNELQSESAQSENLTEVVMKFLSPEERAVLSHLTHAGGECKQQEFAYLNNMGRVKAMRTVQKLAQKGIVSVQPHGKQRSVKLLVDIGLRK